MFATGQRCSDQNRLATGEPSIEIEAGPTNAEISASLTDIANLVSVLEHPQLVVHSRLNLCIPIILPALGSRERMSPGACQRMIFSFPRHGVLKLACRSLRAEGMNLFCYVYKRGALTENSDGQH